MTLIDAIDEGLIPKYLTSEVGTDYYLRVNIVGGSDTHHIDLYYEGEIHSVCKDMGPIGELPQTIPEAVYRLQDELEECPNVDTKGWKLTGRLQTNHPLVQ